MRIGIYIDDIRTPSEVPSNIDEWIVVRSYDDFISTIMDYYSNNKSLPLVFSFDHDLGMEAIESYFTKNGIVDYSTMSEKTGYDCVKWLCDFCISNNIKLTSNIYTHSSNPTGVENMKSYIDSFRKYQNLDLKCIHYKWKIDSSYLENENYKNYLIIKNKCGRK